MMFVVFDVDGVLADVVYWWHYLVSARKDW